MGKLNLALLEKKNREIDALKAALLDALHDDALTTDALVTQVAYTIKVQQELEQAQRELDEAKLASRDVYDGGLGSAY